MTKDSKETIIFIWISAIVFYIMLLLNLYSLFSRNMLSLDIEFNKTMNYLECIGIFIFIIPAFDLLADMLKIAHHRVDKNNKEKNKLVLKMIKVLFNYLFLIFVFTSTTFLLELTADFNDKANELKHYIGEFEAKEDIENYQVNIFENKFYFKDTYFKFWSNDTIFVNDEFTDTFIELFYDRNNVQALNQLIKLDNQNISNKLLEELYYVVQTASTLGYGNIIPQYPIGMYSAIWLVLGSQFITIISVSLIIRE